ncbi:enoyl-CoA hydratase/isomerase family protein [Enterovirga aerilata]|uniref:Enoyl-CoA hydratase/isomerase family protein n=1 Tax=Enterovirga aerilata TaxID=2730920 RepID=A0A849IDS9_9HYPH|nr:enoyl-CoA hydratase-related protein [Enterovirga sp. DB1703]NNM74599.1 enoyl-CoA hydratase/isomerase family protein [Enterovirga sp. DB1703]
MTTESSSILRQERDGAVLILTMNYPERRNALSLPLRAALAEALGAAMTDRDIRAIVLAGAEGNFSSGGDISSMEGVTGVGGRERLSNVHRLIRLLVAGEKPVIAAVEGYAYGAGLSLAAACDIVVAARDARFACSFNRIGLMPDLGAAWTLPLRMGLGRAKHIMLRGQAFGAEEAERWGLAEVLCEPGRALAEAVAIGQELAAVSPLSNGYTKALLARMPRDLEEMLRAEADAQALLFTSADFDEGRRAFLDKRKPAFRGA